MLTGYNQNVLYRDHVFHVQTEDGGLKSPAVSTHLFLGGNVIASKRFDYENLLGSSDLAEQVRSIMKAQHKAILKELLAGLHDEVIDSHNPPR